MEASFSPPNLKRIGYPKNTIYMNEKEWNDWRNKLSIAQKKRWEIKNGKNEILDYFKILIKIREEEDKILLKIYNLVKSKSL